MRLADLHQRFADLGARPVHRDAIIRAWLQGRALADAGTTLLVSTHYMDEAERCHRLAILDRGRLVADGTLRELAAALAG
ncbi:hypothetical protein ABTE60_21120, partial [Acinetobacter baumannii]